MGAGGTRLGLGCGIVHPVLPALWPEMALAPGVRCGSGADCCFLPGLFLWRRVRRITGTTRIDDAVFDCSEPEQRSRRDGINWDGDLERAGSPWRRGRHSLEWRGCGDGSDQCDNRLRNQQRKLYGEHQRCDYFDAGHHHRILRGNDENEFSNGNPRKR